MKKLYQKLKLLKIELKKFNRAEFSDISQRAKSCQVHLEEIQRALENDRANIDLLGSELRSREHLDPTILSSGPMVNLDEEDVLGKAASEISGVTVNHYALNI
ncbi:hypothetical protein ACFE04_015619 [Oxalis oulophora]